MGLCFSCLGFNNESDDINERSSLLGSGVPYADENHHENLLKSQRRQNELSMIVNDLSDNLIDVSTFLSKGASEYDSNKNTLSASQGSEAFATANNLKNVDDDTGAFTSDTSPDSPSGGMKDSDKSLPYLWPLERKLSVMKEMSTSHSSFRVEPPSESLYVVF